GSATPSARPSKGCASSGSPTRRPTSITGRRAGPTRASMGRPSAKSPRCLRRSARTSDRCRRPRFGTMLSAPAPCTPTAASKSPGRTTASPPADAACAVALDLGPTYHFVRRYLERHPPAPLTLRQVDPLIRQLTLYRDLLQGRAPQEGDDDDAAP